MNKTGKKRMDHWADTLQGLGNDARYWDLRRTHGDYSPQVYLHLKGCAEYQASGAQHHPNHNQAQGERT